MGAQLAGANKSLDLFLINLTGAISTWLAVTFYIFVKKYLDQPVRRRNIIFLCTIATLFSILSLSGFLIQSAYGSSKGIVIEQASNLYLVQLATIGLIFIYTIARLILATVKLPKGERARNYLLIGAMLQAVIFNIVGTAFFASSAVAQNIIPITILIMVILIYTGIVRYQLFDIRAVIARVIAYSLSIAFIVGVFVGAILAISNIFSKQSPSLAQDIFLGAAVAFSALAYGPVKRLFDRVSDRIFYRDAYNSQEVINKVNSALVNTMKLDTLLVDSAKILEIDLKIAFVDFYLEPRASIEFHLAGSDTKVIATENWSLLADTLGDLPAKISLVTDDTLPAKVIESMSDLGIECALKMTTGGEDVGFLVVGQRKSGNAFSAQDIQLLEIIADEVAIAVQNALRFEEISQFNVTLQKKIDDATNQLQKSNEKLQKLDEAKDEFISMASHQLRTPLTSVKGYISMILEEDAGPISDQQRTFLDQAFLSSQRMVYLIADLLNVSRLKTGKFIIEPKPTYLPDVIESEIAQLYETAKARDLNMVFNKPEEFPMLNLDETKTRQVIMNFADNAIYYTPKGGKITINLKATADAIEYTVRDTGIGVPKSEQHHLFMKFYRAGNARKARPDGTGLGLFMAKKVVVAQGGAIIFKTEEGKGSTFGFSFPRAKLEVERQ
jgi:signal transduction histidine kinase